MAVQYHTHTFDIPTATNAEAAAGTRSDVALTPSNMQSIVDSSGISTGFPTITAAEAANITPSVHAIEVYGDATVGDGLGGLYIDTNNGASETFISGDGRTWYLAADINPDRLTAATLALFATAAQGVLADGAAQKAQNLADLADKGTAQDNMQLGASFVSVASASAATIPARNKRLRTQFNAPSFATPATLVGGANYRRESFANLGSVPTRAYFRSADRFMPDGTTDNTNGGYWVLDETRISVSMLGAIPGDTAGNLLASFQAAIDFLPSGGGVIDVPDGSFANLVPGSLTVGNKAITFDCRNRTTDLPANMPGVVETNGMYAITESGLTGSARNVRVHNYYKAARTLTDNTVRQYVHHVEGFLPAGLTGSENEFRAYSFDIGSDTANDQHDSRGMKGRMYAGAGNANLRAIYGYSESYGSHTGALTGLIGTVARESGSSDMVAVRGHLQPGASFSGSTAFQAAGNGASRDASFGFSIRVGSGSALNCKTACFSGHAGGAGNLIQQYSDSLGSSINYRVDSLGKETLFAVRSNTVVVADDAALTIAPPHVEGGIWMVITDNISAGTGVFQYRANGTHLLTDIGTKGSLLTLSTASVPTGTTGADGNVNLFCNSGNLYIENRQGAARSFTWLFIGK